MTLNEYLVKLLDECIKHPQLRIGQAMFNTLYDMEPELADEIRGGDSDPFYASTKDDPRAVKFNEFIRTHCKQ